MFLFGHLGIGSKLVSPWSRGLPRRALLLGTILPDLIDKPLYYGLSWITGRRGAELGLISGTRTFAHTAIFLLLVSLAAVLRRSRWMAALALGVATHLLLDSLFERSTDFHTSYVAQGLLWPLFGTQFPVYPFASVGEHLSTLGELPLLWAEAIGAAILAWDYWKRHHHTEIQREFKKSRFRFQRLKRRWKRP